MERKIISRRVEAKRPNKVKRTLNLNEFFDKHNQILIVRGIGGLGDIFMHRMMFEDVKLLMPDAEIHFACPSQYHDAVKDHPFVDRVLGSERIEPRDYVAHYNTTTACGRTEMRLAPFSGPHRSDIWAEHCGLKLTRHNMHIRLSDNEIAQARAVIEEYRDREGPCVVICPISAMVGKNLLPEQLLGTVEDLHKRGCYVLGLHYFPIPTLEQNNIPSVGTDNRLRLWMAILHEADYVVSVDTSALHCAGGMGKPMVGIFTFIDGFVYCKYYPTCEVVQKHRKVDPCWSCGPCYNWGACPKSKDILKPCLTELSMDRIKDGLDRMFERFPHVRES